MNEDDDDDDDDVDVSDVELSDDDEVAQIYKQSGLKIA